MYLPIVKASCKSSQGRQSLYILLDTGSTHSFVTVSALSTILYNTIQDNVGVKIVQLGGTRSRNSQLVRLTLVSASETIEIEAYVINEIMTTPEYPLPPGNSKTKLNDVFPRPPVDVSMIVGNQQLWKVVKGGMQRISPSLVLMDTLWGKVPVGQVALQTQSIQEKILPKVFMSGTEKLASVLERMWKLEEFPLDHVGGSMSRDEVLAVQRIEDLLFHDKESGRFQTGLLFREDPKLINNFKSAAARLESLCRKLRKEQELKVAYCAAMQEFFDLGVAEEVHDIHCSDPMRTDLFYLPHRPVYDVNRSSTKCRPVFDASAKTANGNSLNSCLLAGPPLQLNILSIAMRFRLRPIALIGDISKMFLNIDVRREDRDYLRFLWKDPDDTKASVRIFRFNSLIFGATDSPFQAITCLQKLVQEALKDPNLHEDAKWACHIIKNDTYVDDVTTGGNTVDEVLQRAEALIQLLSNGHFFVKKWASNSPEVLQALPGESCSPLDVVDLGRGFEEGVSAPVSTLGTRWSPREDVLIFDQFGDLATSNEDTKTSVASLLAKIFDPLGLVSPFVLKARKVMKETFIQKINWKESLSSELLDPWHEWVEDTKNLSILKFPRYIPFNETSEIHIFGDGATTCGYGVAVYVRTFIEATGEFVSHILMAKSRIAPMKEIAIPKLELKACLLAAEIAQQILSDVDVQPDRIFCYSDNEVALWWLTKNPRVLVPFVANRVEKIQKWGHSFAYVPTHENPADLASRGTDVSTLGESLWLHGPEFLTRPRCEWPVQKIDWNAVRSKAEAHDGIRKTKIFSYQTRVQPLQRASKFDISSLHDLSAFVPNARKLLGITAFCFKYIDVLKKKMRGEIPRYGGHIPLGRYLERAKIYWIHLVQVQKFAQDIQALETGKKALHSGRLTELAPYLDRDNDLNLPVMRVGGRLARSNLQDEAKHPFILPKDHPFTKALVWGAHVDNVHAGIDWLHYYLRQEYWILSSRQIIRSLVKNCTVCRRLNATRGQQQMALLPEARVNPEPGFTHTGVDYTGQIQLRKTPHGKVMEVGYIAVFTCLTTRAVHLEVVQSNSTYHFLMAFKRFLNTRGMPRVMYSDNAKYFKRADLEIKETIDAANEALAAEAEKWRFSWKYSTELAPHTAGVWESMVKGMKRSLFKVARNAFLTYTELTTVIKELEGLMNDRPLESASEETMDVITPSMLLLGRKIRPWVDKFDETALQQSNDIRERWKYRNTIAQQFWDSWSKQYRLQLSQRAKWHTPRPNVRVGDIVLVEKDKIKRGNWPVARVVKVVRGRDGLVRSLHLTHGSVITGYTKEDKPIWKPGPVYVRSVHGVFPLESAADREVTLHPSEEEENSSDEAFDTDNDDVDQGEVVDPPE